MNTFSKMSGLLSGYLAGLMPCLWIGTIVTGWDFWRIEIDAMQGKPGQFLFNHQTAGSSTLHETLAGILLPLTTCRDPLAAQALQALTTKYFDNPFRGWDPTLDDLVAVRDDLLAIGPLDASTRYFHHTHEAFLSFACTASTYEWLHERFDMLVELEDNDDYHPVRGIKTGPLPATHFEDFAKWFGKPMREEFAGALLYENSD